MVSIKKNILTNLIFFFCLLLFLLLLFKNPFSERNLISNLEPYPDTIHYLAPARNFINGKGFYVEREGRKTTTNVPFLYSAIIMPIFLLNDDPRMFYFVNIILSLIAFFVLYKILNKLFNDPLISGTTLFLYVTNYFIYWYPNLAMAENLILPLFILSFFLLLEKVTPFKIIFVSILAIFFYATKYALIPLSASLILLYLIKILIERKDSRIRMALFFLASTTFLFMSFFLFEYFTKGINVISIILYLIPVNFYQSAGQTTLSQSSVSNPWFSAMYFSKNFPIYLNSITGHPMRFLWDNTPIVPSYVSAIGILGIIGGLISSKFRFISIALLIFLFSQILFLSTFYSADARYIYHAIPCLLIAFALGLFFAREAIMKLFSNKKSFASSLPPSLKGLGFLAGAKTIFYTALIAFAIFILGSNFIRIKSQISLNLRYTETPWYYISVKEANTYFDSLPRNIGSPKPILISALPPYYVDYFSQNRYTLLPLSYDQEYSKGKESTWGEQDYSNLIKLYSSYLERGSDVYVSNYGLGNEAYMHRDFDSIRNNFQLTKVHEGCYNACNIYKLSPKKS